MDAGAKLANEEGIFASLEGAACVAATERLLRSGFLKSADQIVIYNTGSGLKYLEACSTWFPRPLLQGCYWLDVVQPYPDVVSFPVRFGIVDELGPAVQEKPVIDDLDVTAFHRNRYRQTRPVHH
jgi:threonine synthase